MLSKSQFQECNFNLLFFFLILCKTYFYITGNDTNFTALNLPNNDDKMRLLSFVKQNLMNRYILLVCTLKLNENDGFAVGLLLSNHFAVFFRCPLI